MNSGVARKKAPGLLRAVSGYHLRVPDTRDSGRPAIVGISSMATKPLLAALALAHQDRTGCRVAIESVGGVDAAARVVAGEPFDLVLLARDAIDGLAAAGRLLADSAVDFARSDVAVAVRSGAPRPDIATEQALRGAVLAARTIGRSTGPSGVGIDRLFQRWEIADQVRDRIVIATPGIPVAALVARGQVELGFQQRSEMIHADGIDLLGPLPPSSQIVTTFSGAIGAASRWPEAARAFLAFLASPAAADAKRRQGMEPA